MLKAPISRGLFFFGLLIADPTSFSFFTASVQKRSV
jgi:hypothetical protein